MRPHLRFALPALAILLAIGVALAVALGGSAGRSASSSGSASGGQATSGFEGAALPIGQPAQDFTLTDQRGRSVSLHDYRGHVTILTFLYSTCRSSCVV